MNSSFLTPKMIMVMTTSGFDLIYEAWETFFDILDIEREKLIKFYFYVKSKRLIRSLCDQSDTDREEIWDILTILGKGTGQVAPEPDKNRNIIGWRWILTDLFRRFDCPVTTGTDDWEL